MNYTLSGYSQRPPKALGSRFARVYCGQQLYPSPHLKNASRFSSVCPTCSGLNLKGGEFLLGEPHRRKSLGAHLRRPGAGFFYIRKILLNI